MLATMSRRSSTISSRSITYLESQAKEENDNDFIPYNNVHIYDIIITEAIDLIQITSKRDFTDHHVSLNKWKYKSLSERFEKEKPYTLEIDVHAFNEDMIKIHSDCARLCAALHIIKNELNNKGTFEKLKSIVTDFQNTKLDEFNLVNSTEKEKYANLKNEIELLDNRINKLKHDKFNFVESLDTAYIKASMINEVQKIYTEKLGDSVQEQVVTAENMKTTEIVTQIKHTKKTMREERIVHKNIMQYLWISHDEMNKEINTWTKKYADDYHKKFNDILIMKEKRELLQDLMKDLEKKYQRRHEEIEELLTRKEKRKEEKEIEKQQEEIEKQQEEIEKQQEEIEKQQEEIKKQQEKEILGAKKKKQKNGISISSYRSTA